MVVSEPAYPELGTYDSPSWRSLMTMLPGVEGLTKCQIGSSKLVSFGPTISAHLEDWTAHSRLYTRLLLTNNARFACSSTTLNEQFSFSHNAGSCRFVIALNIDAFSSLSITCFHWVFTRFCVSTNFNIAIETKPCFELYISENHHLWTIPGYLWADCNEIWRFPFETKSILVQQGV
jgi:hypothetical protein